MIIRPDNNYLRYCGRIDFDDPSSPEFVYPCSYVKIRFTGTSIAATVSNRHACWNNYLGFITDDIQGKIIIPDDGKTTLTISDKLEDTEHELMLFKRMDSCHMFRFYGFKLSDGSDILPCTPPPARKIEVYGDSISAGEVSEAVKFTGRPDPEHSGEYSNSYYSYAWMLARKLESQLHCIAQGGIALMDGTGWFGAPHYIGMESIYDKIQYHPDLGTSKNWNFRKYRPHIVIIEIGQNDNHPVDFMAENYNSGKSVNWRKHYGQFVKQIRTVYPRAVIILKTSILVHHPSLDRAIDDVCKAVSDPKIHHFMYKRNGRATPGHIRVSEADEMSDELKVFIESLGDSVWQDE
ncbi:MAG TPA: GDSL-type esterase/lipase family protein [Spirochaetota bacterium]|nr:GDSL-type esterase/lipase family protein [Spirochaetota bacterium]